MGAMVLVELADDDAIEAGVLDIVDGMSVRGPKWIVFAGGVTRPFAGWHVETRAPEEVRILGLRPGEARETVRQRQADGTLKVVERRRVRSENGEATRGVILDAVP